MENVSEDSASTNVSSDLNENKVLLSTYSSKRKTMQREDNNERKERAIREMKFLLQSSQKYSDKFLKKLISEPSKTYPKEVRIGESDIEEIKKKNEETVVENKTENTSEVLVSKYFNGSLYPYQKEGLKWMKLLFENGINGILADEMGLGKTVQVIALICNLIENEVIGPYLIVAPLSTLPNWVSEFKRFAPDIPVVFFHGSKNERPNIKMKIRQNYTVEEFATPPVVITSYEYPVMEMSFLQQFRWQYTIIDEGHRIKNFECRLIGSLKKFVSSNRLILTGTPLQNNLLELWSLLNFLLPQIFPNANTFAALFEVDDFEESNKIIEQEQNTNIISTLHGVLEPFMLRRLKSEVLKTLVPKKEVLVYCPMTDFQRDLYKYVLQKNIAKLRGQEEIEEVDPNIPTQDRKRRKCTLPKIDYYHKELMLKEGIKIPEERHKNNNEYSVREDKQFVYNIKMANPMMMLRKIVSHPFTVHCPVTEMGTVIIDEEIVKQSGKMLVLDVMLAKLKERGHKVLIFCTMTQILDFIEDYFSLRDYQYCRLDGRINNLKIRQDSIDSFNNDPEKFVFLISTKAGGLGINLTGADTVILFDRDWNPQNDIQAQDRCHRIGQTKPVIVYSFVTKGTIDENVLRRVNAKRRLEKIVIKKGKFTHTDDPLKKILDLEELETLLKSVDHNQTIQTRDAIFSEEELNSLLDRTELYLEMKK